MTAKPTENELENWIQGYSTYFWDSGDPPEVRFRLEKSLRLLLARDPTQSARLTYSGSDNPPYIGREVQLSLEAALTTGNWYSLHVTAWVPRAWYSEAEFHDYADKAFGYWIRSLQTAPTLGALDAASQELYDRKVQAAVDDEASRSKEREDTAPVTAVKQDILAALRGGMCFRTAHHEGGTIVYFDGKAFVRSVYGESESLEILATDDEALGCIRELYDWESRKDSFPHRPPELEVWTFIQMQLVQDR